MTATSAGAPAETSAGAPAATRAAAPPSVAAPTRGAYARSEVEVAALRSSGAAEQELSLALPFAALFSALLPERSYRIRQLQLDYVDLGRLGERATYSAQIGEALEQGQALSVQLLVARGAWLCVRGRAVLELGAPSGQHQRGNVHG